MNTKKLIILNIFIAIIFAIAIIISSWLLQDSDHAQTVTYTLLALWIIPSSILTAMASRNNK